MLTLDELCTSDPAAPVLIERRGTVLLLTINRPEARNAVDVNVAIAIGDALAVADEDPSVRSVVLTGAGDRSFCSGADLKAIARGESVLPQDEVRRARGFAGYVDHVVGTPTIAAVNGTALGGGTELALASDLVVASTEAVFGLPEVKRGIIAGAGGAFRLARQVPQKVALEMLLTGEPISAALAAEIHLVNRVVEPTQVLPTALELAERIAANAPLAVAATKRLALGIVDGRRPGEEGDWQRSAAEAAHVRASEDAREGARAFAEKRAPVWQGR